MTGEVKFSTTVRDSLFQGTVRPYYRFVGMWDLSNVLWDKDNEDTSFGSIKALFR